jgi:hypothetical protein
LGSIDVIRDLRCLCIVVDTGLAKHVARRAVESSHQIACMPPLTAITSEQHPHGPHPSEALPKTPHPSQALPKTIMHPSEAVAQPKTILHQSEALPNTILHQSEALILKPQEEPKTMKPHEALKPQEEPKTMKTMKPQE